MLFLKHVRSPFFFSLPRSPCATNERNGMTMKSRERQTDRQELIYMILFGRKQLYLWLLNVKRTQKRAGRLSSELSCLYCTLFDQAINWREPIVKLLVQELLSARTHMRTADKVHISRTGRHFERERDHTRLVQYERRVDQQVEHRWFLSFIELDCHHKISEERCRWRVFQMGIHNTMIYKLFADARWHKSIVKRTVSILMEGNDTCTDWPECSGEFVVVRTKAIRQEMC